jgi:uncharacterized Zn finger protein
MTAISAVEDRVMTVFAFICASCGPVKVIPMEDIRKRRASPPSHRCPNCGSQLSADVMYDYEVPLDH